MAIQQLADLGFRSLNLSPAARRISRPILHDREGILHETEPNAYTVTLTVRLTMISQSGIEGEGSGRPCQVRHNAFLGSIILDNCLGSLDQSCLGKSSFGTTITCRGVRHDRRLAENFAAQSPASRWRRRISGTEIPPMLPICELKHAVSASSDGREHQPS